MELIVYAPVFGQSGYEQLSRWLLMALDQIGVNIELRPSTDFNPEVIGLSGNEMSRLRRMIQTRVTPWAPTLIYQLPKGQPVHKEAPAICYTLFETDRCPSPWKQALLEMDRILVFSEFNRQGWIESGIPENKIGALPVAVNSFLYHPDGPRYEIENRKGFLFLTSGDFTERKNFEAVIEAYVKEFSADEDVTLLFKVHYGGFVKRFRRECANKIRECAHRFSDNPPKILFYGDKISNYAMAALYRTADCFVLASRGEGLGMQYLEAAACGIPIICSDWGAHMDYLDETNSYPVKSFLRLIDDPNYIVRCPQALNSKWCQVDIDALRKTMRYVFGGVDGRVGEPKERAARCLKMVWGFTWQKMALALIREVVNIYSHKIDSRLEAEAVPA